MEYYRMTPAEAPLVARLEKLNFSEPWSERSILEAANSEMYRYVVAMDNGCLAGYAGMALVGDEGQITNVCVAVEYRRRGVAAEVMSQLLQIGVAKGVQSFVLEVRVSNVAAIRLYEKLGFVSLGVRPGFYRKPTEDAEIMHLSTVSNDSHY